MQLHKQSVERLRNVEVKGEALIKTFERLLNLAEIGACPTAILHYFKNGDDVQDGDYLPVITLTLQLAGVVNEPETEDGEET